MIRQERDEKKYTRQHIRPSHDSRNLKMERKKKTVKTQDQNQCTISQEKGEQKRKQMIKI